MTISSTARKAGPYVGNSVATSFAFAFKVFAATDLQVVKLTAATGVQSTLLLNTDYSVALNADQNASPGGTVTYPLTGSLLASPDTITIAGNIDALQGVSLLTAGGFYPSVIENAFDRAVILIQQLFDKIGRGLRGPVSDPTTVSMELPPASVRASKALGFDSTGQPIAISPLTAVTDASGVTFTGPDSLPYVLADLANKIVALKGSALVGYADPVAPAYLKTVSDIINGLDVSVFRFIPPSKHSGIQAHTNTDDLAANFTDAANSGAIGLLLPRGYFNSSAITFPATLKRLRGVGPASRLTATGALTASTPWLFFNGQTDINFGDLELNLPKATYPSQYAMQLGACNRGTVSNIHMVSGGYMAMYAPGCAGVAFDNILVDDYAGILFLANTSPNNLTLSRIRSGVAGNNVGIQIAGGSYHWIDRCLVGGAGSSYFNISLFGANDSKVTNNIVLATTREGVQITDGSRNDITNNKIYCGAGHQDFGISIFSNGTDIQHNKIIGNTIIASGGPGIGISAAYTPVVRICQLNSVENNTVVNPCQFTVVAPAAIELLGGATCTGNIVQNNTCFDSTNKMVYGAYEWNSGGNPDNNKFINNPCFGGAGFISEGFVVGPNSKVYDLDWNTFATTITSQTGAITTVDTVNSFFKYKRKGKMVEISARAIITTNGTGAGTVQMTMPFTLANGSLSGRENGVSGKALQTYSGGANLLRIANYDGTYPGANGAQCNVSGVLEI